MCALGVCQCRSVTKETNIKRDTWDALSPFLFLLVVKGVGVLIKKEVEKNLNWRGICGKLVSDKVNLNVF